MNETTKAEPLTAEEEAEFRAAIIRNPTNTPLRRRFERLYATIDRERERAEVAESGNAFHTVAIQQRDSAWSVNKILEQERDEAQQEVERFKSLLTECSDDLHDGDPIACHCAKTDGFGNMAVPPYAGNCLCCRLRAALKEEAR